MRIKSLTYLHTISYLQILNDYIGKESLTSVALTIEYLILRTMYIEAWYDSDSKEQENVSHCIYPNMSG